MQAQALAGLGTGAGLPRCTSTWPRRSSSCLTRCDTAEGVMQAARRAPEAALVQHGGQGLQTGVVQHAELLNIV